VKHPGGEVPRDRAEEEGGATCPRQRGETAQIGVTDARRHLGEDHGKPLEEGGGHLEPGPPIRAADHYETLRLDPHLPGGQRAQPAADIDRGDHPAAGGGGEEAQTEAGEAGSGRTDEAEHPSRLRLDGEGRDGFEVGSARGAGEERCPIQGHSILPNMCSIGKSRALLRRIAFRYAERMTQLVTRIDERLASLVDELVADGVVESRSDAVRRGLMVLVDRHRRDRTADAIVRGYTKQPQTDDDAAWTDEATIRMIGDEPW
jgi:Arc/MetJ-type ribon-helix-helix transcriptional regulator